VAEEATPSPSAEPDARALPPGCAAVREALYRRADGEDLAPAEAKALDAHLAECGECSSELRRAGEFSSHISELLGDLKPPRDIRRNVLNTIGPLGGRRRTVIGAAALGGVALVGLLVLVLSGGAPVARIASSDGDIQVLAFSGGEWRVRARGGDLRRAERVEAAPGATATLDVGPGVVELVGPALVQLERTEAGAAVHCIRETSLLASSPRGASIEIVAGAVRVVVADASVGIKVAPEGRCRIEVFSGEARATDASGDRVLKKGDTADLAQSVTASGKQPAGAGSAAR